MSIHPADGGIYELSTRCLRCGLAGYGRVFLPVSEASAAVSTPQFSDISTDEVIDLHEALKSDDWLTQLTSEKA